MQERGSQEEGWEKKKGEKEVFTLLKMYYINN